MVEENRITEAHGTQALFKQCEKLINRKKFVWQCWIDKVLFLFVFSEIRNRVINQS